MHTPLPPPPALPSTASFSTAVPTNFAFISPSSNWSKTGQLEVLEREELGVPRIID